MSIIAQLTIFPSDKGASVSPYVARTIAIIKESGLPYVFGPMSTSIEGGYDEVMAVVKRCYQDLERDCERIYMTLAVDGRKGRERMQGKVRSVESKL